MVHNIGDEITITKGQSIDIELYRWLEKNDAHLEYISETEIVVVYVITLDPEEVRNQRRIGRLKQMLADTDYQAIKHSEGELTDEEYAPIKAQRRQWRTEINQLEEVKNEK